MTTEIRTFDGRVIRYIPDPCEHNDATPVESDGKVVAYLCPDCDAQLPEFWTPDRERSARSVALPPRPPSLGYLHLADHGPLVRAMR